MSSLEGEASFLGPAGPRLFAAAFFTGYSTTFTTRTIFRTHCLFQLQAFELRQPKAPQGTLYRTFRVCKTRDSELSVKVEHRD